MLILDISILLKDVTRCKALQIKKIACSSAVGFYLESRKSCMNQLLVFLIFIWSLGSRLERVSYPLEQTCFLFVYFN